MATALQDTQSAAARSLGHVALHYQTPEQGPLAARLLTMLGFVETQDLTLPDGAHFYRFVVDPRHQGRGDGIIYLSVVPEAQRKLVAAVRDALKIGTADEHPAVGEMRGHLARDPEYSFHIGTLLESLEELEERFLALEEANRSDPELKGRLKITYNRALKSDPEIEARLNASPIYGKVDRFAYGRNGVQAFVETDILASGTLGESTFLEFDYVFPDRQSHVLSIVEWA
ncbi:hypothetical protein [Sphingomonas jatrophae]|uniref:Uncharacterized protein n=1 Tax=Sphingomonas jatrophae TaxID=1166337 RepID=A0A1I6KLJ9_9SPHN|nr:hypothetical protein [Sphingomonas jatrophae]SFR91918.1 hypothetical protein SAMN05192580_1852 [Sphingomonas jatrophae]